MVGAFVALSVVAIVQFVRGRDPRLLPVMAMAAFQAVALSTPDIWKDISQGAVCVAGLVLIFMLTRPSAPPAKGSR